MAPSRPPQSLLLQFLVLLLVAASIGAASAQYASRSRRSLWARARKLFEFPTLEKKQLSKMAFTYEIAKQPAKPEAAPSGGATDPTSSVADSTPATSSTPAAPSSSNDGFSSGGSSSANFEPSGNPLFPGTVTSTPSSDPKTTPKTPSTPSQQPGDVVAATAVPTQAASPSTPPPPPPPPPSTGPCPPLPSMCDFYFQGSTSTLPVFNISDGVGDTRLGGPIEASIRGATVEVIAANSELADYICQDGVNVWSAPSASSGNSTTLGPDNQFYAVQDGVQSRTFQPAAGGVATYQGKGRTTPTSPRTAAASSSKSNGPAGPPATISRLLWYRLWWLSDAFNCTLKESSCSLFLSPPNLPPTTRSSNFTAIVIASITLKTTSDRTACSSAPPPLRLDLGKRLVCWKVYLPLQCCQMYCGVRAYLARSIEGGD
ncbi:unnamed protein product [Closterium sp. NIES-53]